MTLTYVFSVRSLFTPIWKNGLFTNGWLWLGVLGGVILQILVVYWLPLQTLFGTVALRAFDWLWMAAVSALILILIEAVKFFGRLGSRVVK